MADWDVDVDGEEYRDIEHSENFDKLLDIKSRPDDEPYPEPEYCFICGSRVKSSSDSRRIDPDILYKMKFPLGITIPAGLTKDDILCNRCFRWIDLIYKMQDRIGLHNNRKEDESITKQNEEIKKKFKEELVEYNKQCTICNDMREKRIELKYKYNSELRKMPESTSPNYTFNDGIPYNDDVLRKIPESAISPSMKELKKEIDKISDDIDKYIIGEQPRIQDYVDYPNKPEELEYLYDSYYPDKPPPPPVDYDDYDD